MIWLVGTMWLSLAAALLIGIALGWVLFRAGRRTIKQGEWDRVEEERSARQGRIRELDDEVKRLRPVAARVPALEGEKAGYHAAQRRVAELEAESTSLRATAESTGEFEHEAAELRSELTNRAVRIGDLERELAQAKASSTVDLREAADSDRSTTMGTAAPVAVAAARTAAVVTSNNLDERPPPPVGASMTTDSTSAATPDGASNSLADAEFRRQMAARDRRIEQLESRIRRLEAPSNGDADAAGVRTSNGNGTQSEQTSRGEQFAPAATAPVVSTPSAAVQPEAASPMVTAPVVSAAPPQTAPVVSAPAAPPAPAIAMPVQVANVSTADASMLDTPPIPPAPARTAMATPTAPVVPEAASERLASSAPAPPVPNSVDRAIVRSTATTAAVAGGAGVMAGAAASGAGATMIKSEESQAMPATAPRRTMDPDPEPEPVPADHGSSTTTVGSGGRDDLTEIIGIGPKLEGMLNGLGVVSLGQLAALDDAGVDDLQRKLPDFPGRVRRDDWAGQARRVLAARG